jgi:2-aminophenol/2-amino-5-chlorophenol 1,6-dioxygenase alpha subunit
MTVVAGFLLPGSPLPLLVPDNPVWRPLVLGMQRAGKRLAELEVDLIAVYSTQWVAVLDQLWQTRAQLEGVHVDETWHEYGEIPFSLRVDSEFAKACVERATESGLRSRSVDYDAFPIDTGTLVASRFLDPSGQIPFAMTSNNLYHDADTTRTIGKVVREVANLQEKRVAVVGVGGLSGSLIREAIDLAADHIARPEDDVWNRRVLDLLEAGRVSEFEALWGDFASDAKADMGFKHFAFLLGALDGRYRSAEILGYGPTHGAGAAAMVFEPAPG